MTLPWYFVTGTFPIGRAHMIRGFMRRGAENRITYGVCIPDALFRIPATYKPGDGVVM